MQKELEIVYREIGEKYNVPAYVVEEMFLFQFKFTAQQIRKDPHKITMLPSFGKFAPSLKKIKWILKHNERNSNNALQRSEQRDSGGEEN